MTSSSPRSREKIVDWRRSTSRHRLHKASVAARSPVFPRIEGAWASDDRGVSTCSITSGSWVAQTTAAPVARARRASRIATEIAFAPSSREVGSSASRTSGPGRDARAIATRARSPCERRPTRWVARSDSPTESSAASAVGPRLVAPAERERELDVLERGEVRDEAGLLADVGDLRRGGAAARAARSSAVSSVPSTVTVPASGSSSPASRCSSVVLPEPDGPVTACSRPACSSTSTSVEARASVP